MAEYTTIARPYAKAAFEVALEQASSEKNAISLWGSNLQLIAEVVATAEMQDIIVNPEVPDQVAIDVIFDVCAGKLNEQQENFVRVVSENRRLLAFVDIAALYTVFQSEYEKTMEVDVTSAVALESNQQTALISALEKRLEKKVTLNCSIDESIVGGMIVRAGDLVIDGSLSARVQRLSSALHS